MKRHLHLWNQAVMMGHREAAAGNSRREDEMPERLLAAAANP